MKQYSIWAQGFAATGQSGQAFYHGIMEATSFKDACGEFFKNDPLYDPVRGTYWGCRLFDNETNARLAFG